MNNRYDRQIQIKDFGVKKQEELKKSSVLVIGLGGLGSCLSINLAMMGVGHIGLIDGDIVSESNLNRQMLYTEEDIGKKKAICAMLHLNKINSEINIDAYDLIITEENINTYIESYDYIVAATDNIKSRLIINDACIKYNKILINGAIEAYNATIQLVKPRETPCLRCIYKDTIDSNVSLDAIAPPCSTVSSLMANILLLYIIDHKNVLGNNMLVIDFKSLSFEQISINKSIDCICNNK